MKQSVTITGENLNVVVNNANEAAIPVSGARLMSKAEMRIAALKAKGIDTSCYFPLGSDQVVKIEDGNAVPVDMTDEVEKKLVEGGYINHYTLFRRWVMSQMFRMLRKQEDDSEENLTKQIQDHGYEYSWRMVEREMNAQAKMLNHGDKENFTFRNIWFNGGVVSEMAHHYVKTLEEYVNDNLVYRKNKKGKDTYKHTCKGYPYVRLSGKDVFVSDLDKKVYSPLRNLARKMGTVSDPAKLCVLIHEFNSLRRKLQSDTKLSQSFINAYKGSGAYFTCKNLILFHGATFRNGGKFMGQKKSLKYLDDKAIEYRAEGWRMIGVMKQLIEESNISIQGKMNEWK